MGEIQGENESPRITKRLTMRIRAETKEMLNKQKENYERSNNGWELDVPLFIVRTR